MSGSLEFANPPIVELVLGAQFSPLTRLTAGHFGKLWQALGPDWIEPGDGPPVEDHFELFDRPRPAGRELPFRPLLLPARFTLGHKGKDRLLQFQSTRFHLNWRKREGFYPSYSRLIAEYEEVFAQVSAFAEGAGLGELALNQWELTYVDSFPKGEYWETPADWPRVLPGLFGNLSAFDGLPVSMEHRAAEWRYEITPKRGRLHVAAGQGLAGEDQRESLLLTMTARGPVGKGGAATLREGLDLGHEVALGAFMNVASDEAKKRWGAKP
ncbi:MAG: TIGR04255 family protein [Gemmataceae bacterium]|nr:TIGR04255 family protein [Gemmataceae bacterium]